MKIKPEELELPVTLISNGKLLRNNLPVLGKDEEWLRKILCKQNCTVSQVYLLTAEPSGKIYFAKKSEEP